MLRAAIIGLGNQSLNDHIPSLLRRSDVRIIAVIDPSNEAHEQFEVMYPDLAKSVLHGESLDILDGTAIDFAIVAIPHNHYYDTLKFLCSRNIPFMKEKPFARTLTEAMHIGNIPNISKFCFTCTQRKYSPLYRIVRDMLPAIGEPITCDVFYNLRVSEPAAGWRSETSLSGGGVIIDMGYHIIDQLTGWFDYPEQVQATITSEPGQSDSYDTEDSAIITMHFKNPEVECTLNLSRSEQAKEETFTINGERGEIIVSLDGLTIQLKGQEPLSYVAPPKSMLLDNQLEFFIHRVREDIGFEDNHTTNVLDMKIIENCYRKAISKDHAIYVSLLKHGNRHKEPDHEA